WSHLQSEVQSIIYPLIRKKSLDSKSRQEHLKVLNKFSSCIYFDLKKLFEQSQYPFESIPNSIELTYYINDKINWQQQEKLLHKIVRDWLDITYDNAKTYSASFQPQFKINNSHLLCISITNPACLDEQSAHLIENKKIRELSAQKKRGTGYPKLLSDIKFFNKVLEESQQSFQLKLELKQDNDQVYAALCFENIKEESNGLKILIIDDDAQSKYFQHESIKQCFAQHKITIAESFQSALSQDKAFDIIYMDRNFPFVDGGQDFVSLNEMMVLCHKFDQDLTYLVSTDFDDCKHLFLENHILSIRDIIKNTQKQFKDIQ
ncbi:hypothetical protein MJH12_11650, partial [bacterium]|nr:hypothetical protein [bacterium]